MAQFSEEQVELGARLKKRRLQFRLSQQQLADAAGINRATLGQYETGRINIPIEELVRLASILSCPIGYFFGETDTDYLLDRAKLAATMVLGLFNALDPIVRTQVIALLIDHGIESAIDGILNVSDTTEAQGWLRNMVAQLPETRARILLRDAMLKMPIQDFLKQLTSDGIPFTHSSLDEH